MRRRASVTKSKNAKEDSRVESNTNEKNAMKAVYPFSNDEASIKLDALVTVISIKCIKQG